MNAKIISLFTHSKDVFFVMDMDGIILHTNQAFRNTFNYTEHDLADLNFEAICHPADKERKEENLGSLMRDKKLVGYQSRIKAKDGCYFSMIWSLILGEDENLIYATGNVLAAAPCEPGHDIVQHTIQSLNEGFVVLDAGWNIAGYNPAFQAMANLEHAALQKVNFMQIESLGLIDRVAEAFSQALAENKSVQVQYLNAHSNSWLRINIYPYNRQLAVFVRDITEIKMQEWVLKLEKDVLELNASTQNSLAQNTAELLKGIENIFPEMLCSVLEIDDHDKLVSLAAPRLPKAYCDLIEDMPIGPNIGSCGTAAFHRKQIIVSDIENDPLWANYKHLAQPYGLKACWSTPVISSKGAKVLATFAIYYHVSREPTELELSIIARTVNILRVLIESKRTEESIMEQNHRLQTIANISSHELRRPVATIMGLVNLFDDEDLQNPLNKEIMTHLDTTSQELDGVIHSIVERTVYIKASGTDD
ncbi:PAS domain S-box protein [Mucilaginibacter celer]|uniref:histidine kinase n=1 Tax=Mucilaginibacter celer TaxID=2305508 RepID=A0A494VJM1_9SPHI|nr:PAS domain S-box protein [Mucilaginibacter celer]AYL94029.1 PAS domain S-box protein [Mucilaginibacter celer]